MVASAFLAPLALGAGARARAPSGPRRVAFVLGDFANVIDVGGPWEVFQDVMGAQHRPEFELLTVAPSRSVIRMTGGLAVVPDFDFGTVPPVEVIVVPAQRTDERTIAWLRRVGPRATVTLSACTGAFQVARAGLLDGLAATTHHESLDSFEREFPKVRVERDRRWVDSGTVVTAGGLTSGIDAALHVVSRLVGVDAASRTASFMEHDGDGWRTGRRDTDI